MKKGTFLTIFLSATLLCSMVFLRSIGAGVTGAVTGASGISSTSVYLGIVTILLIVITIVGFKKLKK